jgi:hypothetical protein
LRTVHFLTSHTKCYLAKSEMLFSKAKNAEAKKTEEAEKAKIIIVKP